MLGMDRWNITSVRTDRYCTLYRGLYTASQGSGSKVMHRSPPTSNCVIKNVRAHAGYAPGVSVSISMPMNVSDSEFMYSE